MNSLSNIVGSSKWLVCRDFNEVADHSENGKDERNWRVKSMLLRRPSRNVLCKILGFGVHNLPSVITGRVLHA